MVFHSLLSKAEQVKDRFQKIKNPALHHGYI